MYIYIEREREVELLCVQLGAQRRHAMRQTHLSTALRGAGQDQEGRKRSSKPPTVSSRGFRFSPGEAAAAGASLLQKKEGADCCFCRRGPGAGASRLEQKPRGCDEEEKPRGWVEEDESMHDARCCSASRDLRGMLRRQGRVGQVMCFEELLGRLPVQFLSKYLFREG